MSSGSSHRTCRKEAADETPRREFRYHWGAAWHESALQGWAGRPQPPREPLGQARGTYTPNTTANKHTSWPTREMSQRCKKSVSLGQCAGSGVGYDGLNVGYLHQARSAV